MKDIIGDRISELFFMICVVVGISIVAFFIDKHNDNENKFKQMMAQQGYEECPKSLRFNDSTLIWVKDCVSYKKTLINESN